MSDSSDAYWDELGIAWRASPDARDLTPRLGRRLRWQGLCFNAAALAGVPLSIGGLALGGFTIWIGWGAAWNFVVRGAALIVISLLMALGAWSLRTRVRDDARSLAEMIDLAIGRSERAIGVARLGYWACAVAAAFGLAGYAVRVHLGRPPAMSPLVPLGVLAILAVAIILYRRRLADDLAKLRYLAHALSDAG